MATAQPPRMALSWQAIENLVLRPPRSVYTCHDLLGGEDGDFSVTGPDGAPVRCFRMDVELTNGRGERLVASHFLPTELWKTRQQLPCVIYCHGNAGCRVDANVAAFALLRTGVSVFAFDFGGSGQSDGDIVTLGARESGDLDTAVAFLRGQGRTGNIALWGRSMGAVTCVLYARTNLSIAGVVLDSPFGRLPDLMRDIVTRDITADAPSVLVSVAIAALRSSIRRRTGVDIAKLDAVAAAAACYQPALIVHAEADELIYPGHSRAVAAAWAGDCRLMVLGEGQGHNSARPRHVVASATTFLGNVLGGGLKDAEQLFANVGFGQPPPPTPRAAAGASARAAELRALAMAAEVDAAAGDDGGGDDDSGAARRRDGGGAGDDESESEPAFGGGGGEDDDDDGAEVAYEWERAAEEAARRRGGGPADAVGAL